MRGRLAGPVVLFFALALGVTGVGACTSADGEVRGGQWRDFDAGAPAPLDVPITEPTFADSAPDSWRGIYRDFFGKRARSSCAGNGTCHGAPGQSGSNVSNFICADVDGCWQSLRTAKDPDPRISIFALVEESSIAAPESAYLFKIIRYRGADGTLNENRGMPLLPRDYAFKNADILRMQAWIRNGAKND